MDTTTTERSLRAHTRGRRSTPRSPRPTGRIGARRRSGTDDRAPRARVPRQAAHAPSVAVVPGQPPPAPAPPGQPRRRAPPAGHGDGRRAPTGVGGRPPTTPTSRSGPGWSCRLTHRSWASSPRSAATGRHGIYDLGPLLYWALTLPVHLDHRQGMLWGSALFAGLGLVVAVEAGWTAAGARGGLAVSTVRARRSWLSIRRWSSTRGGTPTWGRSGSSPPWPWPGRSAVGTCGGSRYWSARHRWRASAT